MSQKIKKGTINYGYCYKCQNIGNEDPYFDTGCAKNGLSHFKAHVATKHEKLDLTCSTCGQKFKQFDKLQKHICTKAKASSARFTKYKLRKENTVLQKVSKRGAPDPNDSNWVPYPTEPLSPLQLYDICFNERFAVAGAFPGIAIANSKQQAKLSMYGNTKLADFYCAVLDEKIKAGGANEIILHKNICVVDEENDQVC